MKDEFTNSAVHYGPFKFTEMDRRLSQMSIFPILDPQTQKAQVFVEK